MTVGKDTGFVIARLEQVQIERESSIEITIPNYLNPNNTNKAVMTDSNYVKKFSEAMHL